MLRWFPAAPILLLLAAAAQAAPPAAAKSKKDPAPEEKKKEAPTDTHKVRRGETLWGIARLHGVSVGDVMDLNHLTDSTVRDGQVLKIPRPGGDPALAPSKTTIHPVLKGETFRTIARKYGLTPEDLEKANPKINAETLKPGTKIIIPASVIVSDKPVAAGEKTAPPPAPTPVATHTVTDKDTYYTIAKKYGTTESALAAANPGVNPDRLRPGSKLNLPAKPAPAASSKSASGRTPSLADAARKSVSGTVPDETVGDAPGVPAPGAKPKTRRYIVSADETAQTIGEAFHISVAKLYDLNGLKPGTPFKKGMEIQVPDGAPGARP